MVKWTQMDSGGHSVISLLGIWLVNSLETPVFAVDNKGSIRETIIIFIPAGSSVSWDTWL